jgi:UDP-glucose 6-dehydrogenase
VDISQPRIDAWNSDKLPIYEPRLDDVVLEARCVRNRLPRLARPVRAARSPPHA